MSQHLHKHYFPPLCILTDCWCCGLRTAVVFIACLTSLLAAFTFVYYICSMVFGVQATGTYVAEYYMEKSFNTSMFMVYRSFNRSAQRLCYIRFYLTSTTSVAGGERRLFVALRRGFRTSQFNLADIPPDLRKIFTLEELAYLAHSRLDYDSPPGQLQAKEFWRSYGQARAAKQEMVLPHLLDTSQPAPSLYNFHFWFPQAKEKKKPKPTDDFDAKPTIKISPCAAPFLVPRVRVDKKMNLLRVLLLGGFLFKMQQVGHIIAAVGLVTAVAAMAASALLIFGVIYDSPKFFVPWLVVEGFLVLFNLVYFNTSVAMWYKATNIITPSTIPTIIVFSSLVVIFMVLSIFVVASYFYLLRTTGFYLQRMPRTSQLVVSGSTEPSPETEIELNQEKLKR